MLRALTFLALALALACPARAAWPEKPVRVVDPNVREAERELERSLGVALRKRPVQADQVEQMVNRIVRQLESLGETEIPSSTVGDFIMKALKGVDEVAYVRYASVYKDFRHTGDFAKFLGDEGFDEPSGKS